jgi:hypothetical protein
LQDGANADRICRCGNSCQGRRAEFASNIKMTKSPEVVAGFALLSSSAISAGVGQGEPDLCAGLVADVEK